MSRLKRGEGGQMGCDGVTGAGSVALRDVTPVEFFFQFDKGSAICDSL